MCKRDELKETIGIAAQSGCDPTSAARLLKNVARQIKDSDSGLSDEDKAALTADKDAAKTVALANYQQLLEAI